MRIAVAGGTGVVGRHVVTAAATRGHDPVVLSRSAGVDVVTGDGLAAALAGADAIIDVTNSASTRARAAREFFEEAARSLQQAGAATAVAQIVTLSIVGIDRLTSYGYYRAKVAQERVAAAGPVPATIVRTTQFHEFPAEIMTATRRGPVAVVPRMLVQPVAARTVAEVLVDAAEAEPSDEIVEVAGPERGDLVVFARRLLQHRGIKTTVVPLRIPGAAGRGMRGGLQLPGSDARICGPDFRTWLATEDSAYPPL